MMKNKSSGSVLIICLVLLSVISIIGVVSMQSSSLQEKFSRNIFYNVQSFQAAVNEQSQQYNSASKDEGLLLEVLSENRVLDAKLDIRHAVMESSIMYVGEGLPPSGYSLGKYRGLKFSIDTKSTYENIDAISNQTLGFQYAAPKSI